MKKIIYKIKLMRSPYVLLNDLVSNATIIKRINKCELYYIGDVCIFFIDNKSYYQRVCIDESIIHLFNSYYNFNDKNESFHRCIQNVLRDNKIDYTGISTSYGHSYCKKFLKPLHDFLTERYLK